MYEILFTKKAEKELNKLTPKDTKVILKKISKLTFPFPKNLDSEASPFFRLWRKASSLASNSKARLKNIVGVKGFYRLRSGKMRAIFEVDKKKKKIWIRKVGYRSGIYRF